MSDKLFIAIHADNTLCYKQALQWYCNLILSSEFMVIKLKVVAVIVVLLNG